MGRATGLQVAYGAIQVVWGVDLAVDRGQVVALIGPNGAGKTTTLRALAGLLPARQGTIRFAGQAGETRARPRRRSLPSYGSTSHGRSQEARGRWRLSRG